MVANCATALGSATAAAPSAAPQRAAEYKQVTVLFADVVHSMDIAAAVGAERLREIMADLFGRAAAIIQRYGGTVDKFTGDGIMALFGAPVALEDHAFRACLAALDIQRDRAAGRRGAAPRRRRAAAAGWAELGSGDRRRNRLEPRVTPRSASRSGWHNGWSRWPRRGGVMLSESTARLVEDAAVPG